MKLKINTCCLTRWKYNRSVQRLIYVYKSNCDSLFQLLNSLLTIFPIQFWSCWIDTKSELQYVQKHDKYDDRWHDYNHNICKWFRNISIELYPISCYFTMNVGITCSKTFTCTVTVQRSTNTSIEAFYVWTIIYSCSKMITLPSIDTSTNKRVVRYFSTNIGNND